jgi:hypothetical protein
MCTKPEDSPLIPHLNKKPVIFLDFKRVMLQPDNSQNDKEAKVDKIILFLTNFEGYIDQSLKEQIKATVMD